MIRYVMMSDFEHKESTIRFTFLSYMVLMVILITLLPLKFQFPRILRFTWHFYVSGIVGNLLLFMPLGFFFRMSRGQIERSWCLRELVLGLIVSFMIEFIQGFIPGRVTSGYDLIANGIGAWGGAHFFLWAREKINQRKLAGLFALELPLINLVYLLIPLLWLNGLSAGESFIYAVRTVLLGFMGTYLMVAIYVYGIRGDAKPSRKKFAGLVIGWFVLSAFPILMKFPIIVSVAGVAFGVMAYFKIQIPLKRTEDCQRYELPTLKRILPVFIIYLVMLFFLEGQENLAQLSIKFFQDFRIKMMLIFGFLERVGAMTITGYLIAEMRGRKNDKLSWILILIASIAFSLCMVGLIYRGKSFLSHGGVLEILLLTASSVYGGMIYRIQLKSIKYLLNQPC